MPFELKVIDKIQCPRCNAWAEIRIDQGQMETESKMILSFVVCSKCKLTRYYGTTTEKAIRIISKINKLKRKLKNLPENSPLRDDINAKIEKMQKARIKAEILF